MPRKTRMAAAVTKPERSLLAQFDDDGRLSTSVLRNGTLRSVAERLERRGLARNQWPATYFLLTDAGRAERSAPVVEKNAERKFKFRVASGSGGDYVVDFDPGDGQFRRIGFVRRVDISINKTWKAWTLTERPVAGYATTRSGAAELLV